MSNKTRGDAYDRVMNLRIGSLANPTEEYLLGLRELLREYMVEVEEKIAEVSAEWT